MLCSPIGDAPSCRCSKPRCCAIPSAVDVDVDDDDDDDVAIALFDAPDADAATPKALARIELDFKTTHIIMVGIVNAWNFMLMRGFKTMLGDAVGKSDGPVK
jgi:hypothetical protein